MCNRTIRITLSTLSALLALIFTTSSALAQVAVTGTVVDATDRAPLPGANVIATRLTPDSTQTGLAVDAEGAFRLSLPAGEYRLRVSFVGYRTLDRQLTVTNRPVSLGEIALERETVRLGEAVVEATQERVILKGDTTVYNADAFRVNPNATAEDLVAKMPGVVIQDGTVQAHGEQVRRVLVDGEEFFGDDAVATLRNLPAEIIKEVEVYDRESDQARFTGFSDGETEKTINVVTRSGMQNGQFGRIYGGYGTTERYVAGGTVNIFDGSRRISIIGLTNNINQQNFGTEDLLGILNASNNQQRGGGPPRGGGRPGGGGPPGGGGGWGWRGGMGNYMVGERAGVNTTSALGLNYVDRWGEKIRVNGSYFLNLAGNNTDALSDREYFLTGGANQFYSETNKAESDNANHRFNLRLEATLSESTELTFTPRISVQQSSSSSTQTSLSTLAGGDPLSQSTNKYTSENLGISTNSNLLIRHRFPTRGRTISANIGINLNGRDGESRQDVLSRFFLDDVIGADSTDAYNRLIDNEEWNRSFSVRLAYTEPVTENSQLEVTYAPSLSKNAADRPAFLLDPITGTYIISDTEFTSYSDQQMLRQRGGITYQYRTEKWNASVGLDIQDERLNYEQEGTRAFEVNRNFFSILPTARLRARFSERLNLEINYRPDTDPPGVSQLRDVIDDSNPLLITGGNPDLKTSMSHRVDVRLRSTNPESGRMLMGFFNLSTTQNYIGTAAFVADKPMMHPRGVFLEPGAQFSYPVNLDGYFSARSFVMFGHPLSFIKSNANLSTGISYTSTPSLINNVENRANAVSLDGRAFIGSNISERLDFSLSYGVSYTTVSNSAASIQQNNYARQRAGIRLNWLPLKQIILMSDLSYSNYSGLSASVEPTEVMWNVGIGYRFMKNEMAEVRLTITDLLGQQNSTSRTVTGLYIEDSASNTLGRYVMLNLIYKLRQFGM